MSSVAEPLGLSVTEIFFKNQASSPTDKLIQRGCKCEQLVRGVAAACSVAHFKELEAKT